MDPVYTAKMGNPPQEPDDGSAMPKKILPPTAKKAPAKKAPVRQPSPAQSGIFREGMPVPQEPDDRSATSTPKQYAKGGYVRAADGIAKKGKTKGRLL